MPESDFLKIDGIEGESVDDKHKKWIEVVSYSWGVHQSKTAVSGTGKPVASKAGFEDLFITKYVDQATTDIIKKCIIATPLIKEVILHLCIAGETHEPYLIFTLKNCVISSGSYGGGGDSEPVENLAINYEDITIEYKAYKEGNVAGSKVAHWNLKENKA